MKILIEHFSSLNNYGTGMMGLVVIQKIIDRYPYQHIDIYIRQNKYTDLVEINSELQQQINIIHYNDEIRNITQKIKNKIIRRIFIFKNLVFPKSSIKFDKVIVLGGDDLSEFYSKRQAGLEILRLARLSKHSEIILLGQTIGPFNRMLNRFIVKNFLSKIKVYARDIWTSNYLKEEFDINVQTMGDLAFNNLPLQLNHEISQSVLTSYNLDPNKYITIVVSGLYFEGYYTDNKDDYLRNYTSIINYLLNNKTLLKIEKVVLLAHTFPPYGDERILNEEIYQFFNDNINQRDIVLVNEKILPTRARFILGNGRMTITGRMHPGVSTLQMQKPAIFFSYSPKYNGVVSSVCPELLNYVLDASKKTDWENNNISAKTINAVQSIIENYSTITDTITQNVNRIKENNNKILNSLFR